MSNTEKMGYDALKARLTKANLTVELEMVEVVWEVIKHHPVGDAGLLNFSAKIHSICEKVEKEKQRQMDWDN